MSFSINKSEVVVYPPSALRDFRLYGFEWIDNLRFVRSPNDFVANSAEYIDEARTRFLEAGWQGDGEIGLLWIPPFVFPVSQSVPAVGVVVWHVKQDEDGVTFLLSPIDLPFEEFEGR
jgi:hypothetical protein